MRVLMTGMAARGVGSTRTRHKITSLPDAIGAALRELGHDVDGPRRVPMGERVAGRYDAALVQLGWPSSLSSTYGHEAARVMADMEGSVLRYVDDWRSQWLADDVAGHVGSERGWHKHTTRFRRAEYEGVGEEERWRIRSAYLAPIAGECPIMVPLLAWGDPALFDVSTKARLAGPVLPLDPQELVPYTPSAWAEDTERSRRWVVASLQEHDRWVASQGLGWPVLRMGANRKLSGGVPVPGSTNQVVPEAQVVQAYAESWGVLSPEYLSAGSGYWRTRYDQAMGAGALLWPGPTDAAAMGPEFLPPPDVEGMTTAQLGDLQAAQAARLDGWKWPRERALATLDGYLRDWARG